MSIPTRWIVLAGLVIARLAFAFQLQVVAVVAPGIMKDLALDVVQIGTLAGLFMLPGLLLAIPGGMISQRIGERSFLIGCLLAMTAGGVLCGLAEGYWIMWLGRLISGFGAIGVNVAMSKIVIDWFAEKELSTAMALFLVGFPGGIALALVTLGFLATPEDWPLAFFATAGFSFFALVAFLSTYRPVPKRDEMTSTDVRLSPGEFAMTSVSGMIWGLYNAGSIIFVSFVPLYLVSTGLNAGKAAALVGIGMWLAIIAGPLGGVIADRTKRPNLLITTAVLLRGAGMLLVIPLSDSIPLLTVLLVVTVFCGNLAVGPIVGLVSEVLRPEVRGTGMGVFYTWLYGGLAVGPMLGGYASGLLNDAAGPIYLVAWMSILTVLMLAVFRLLRAQGHPSAISS